MFNMLMERRWAMLGRGRGLLERMWPMATHEASDGASSMRERGRGWGVLEQICWKQSMVPSTRRIQTQGANPSDVV